MLLSLFWSSAFKNFMISTFKWTDFIFLSSHTFWITLFWMKYSRTFTGTCPSSTSFVRNYRMRHLLKSMLFLTDSSLNSSKLSIGLRLRLLCSVTAPEVLKVFYYGCACIFDVIWALCKFFSFRIPYSSGRLRDLLSLSLF